MAGVLPAEVAAVLDDYAHDRRPSRESEKAAVKATLSALVAVAPGRSVEVRIPPYAAVQVIAAAAAAAADTSPAGRPARSSSLVSNVHVFSSASTFARKSA